MTAINNSKLKKIPDPMVYNLKFSFTVDATLASFLLNIINLFWKAISLPTDLIDDIIEQRQNLNIAFINFRKAFGCVNEELYLQEMGKLGCAVNLVGCALL